MNLHSLMSESKGGRTNLMSPKNSLFELEHHNEYGKRYDELDVGSEICPKTPFKEQIPVNVRLDLAEAASKQKKRSNSKGEVKNFNDQDDLAEMFEKRKKKIQSTFQVMEGSEFSHIFSDFIEKPDKVSSY